MIVAVTLNAAVDKTYRIDGFALDRVHRPSEWRIVAGGKGINVARVYRTLGGDAYATGFLGGVNGRFIEQSLSAEGIPGSFVRTRQESRVCIAVVDHVANTQTEINEVGPTVSPAELRAMRRKVGAILESQRPDVVVFSGSCPPGVPTGFYAELIELARSAGVRTALDASGDALREGLTARPWLVKPNQKELGDAVGRMPSTTDEVVAGARELIGKGVTRVLATLGARGCVYVDAGAAFTARPPEIDFVSAVGSGDAFLAAYLWADERGATSADAVRLAVGAGAANTSVYGAGFVEAGMVRSLAAGVALADLQCSPCGTLG